VRRQKSFLNVAKEQHCRLSYTYEKVFHQIYDYLVDRQELKDAPKLGEITYETIALGRSEFIDVYNMFVSYCLDKTLELR
jgi:hypothetical protein